jgi:BMFP domain-containing protein YqiC
MRQALHQVSARMENEKLSARIAELEAKLK